MRIADWIADCGLGIGAHMTTAAASPFSNPLSAILKAISNPQ
jgi:hypothetical protein